MNTKHAVTSGTLAVLACLALAASPAHAAVIAQYNFAGGVATSSDTELNSTAGDFTVTATAGLGLSSTQNNAFAQTHTGGTTHPDVTAAITHGNFFSFTVTPDPGQWLNLTSLTYDSIHNNTGATTLAAANATATMNFFVRSSVDGFAANVGSTFSEGYVNTSTPTGTGRTVDLTGGSFQNVTNPVTFRFYAFESVQLSTRQGARWDNVVLNGTLEAVPETSTALLGGIGALLLLRRRRN